MKLLFNDSYFRPIKTNQISITLRISILALLAILSCNAPKKEAPTDDSVKIVGAMKNVMWQGELGSSIDLDTISNKNGLYGLGPLSYLEGEILINDGQSYVSKVNADATMTVEKRFDISAPFFIYANVTKWNEFELPSTIKSTQDLEQFIDGTTAEYKRPFVFKLKGSVSKAVIHIQNLPKETKVSSPDDAHQHQVAYDLYEEYSEIVGFFSTAHQGVFTHHDSFLHMHLITKDENKMGHLDELVIANMTLYLPKN